MHVGGARAMALSARAAAAVFAVGALTYLYSTTPLGQPAIQDFLHDHEQTDGRYLVWSPSCRIPDVDPRHPSIRHLLRPAQSIVCSQQRPPSYTERLPDGGHALRLEPSAGTRNCCYSAITRYSPTQEEYAKEVDNLYNISSCRPLVGEAQLSAEEQFVLVQCNGAFVNGHAIVAQTEAIRQRAAAAAGAQGQQPSILLIGFDSMSRLNLARTMPRTSSLLRRSGWIELDGYNKIADNTFPNLMAVLTGLSVEKIRKACWKTQYAVMDDCPIIWKDFQRQGYVTAYAEDEPSMSTFNYHKAGFRAQPTDYYFRPFISAAMKKLKIKRRYSLNICTGPVPTAEHMFRYTVDFVTTFQNALYFALIWINNFSHNDHNTPGAMDVRVMQLFQELIETNVLNNTIVVFFSDHGMRFGKLRETVVGWLEERLPFIYFWIPEWFRKKYPESYNNLSINKNRLTSPFDLYETLKDILNRSGSDISGVSVGNVTSECPLCRSLFTEIPYDRKCEDAGISPHWCTCSEYKSLSPKSSILLTCAKSAVLEIATKLRTANTVNDEHCSELRLKRVVEGRSKTRDLSSVKNTDYNDYIVVFETVPGDALFEATVRHAYKGKDSCSVLGTISRLNAYADQSKCVTDSQLKLYCYCSKH